MNSVKQVGATLIELVTAIVIIAIATTGLILLVSDTGGKSADPLVLQQANMIAQAYMEEIQQKQFCDPDYDVDSDPLTPLDCPADCTASVCDVGGCRNLGSALEGNRSLFDDVCDFNSISGESPTGQTGALINGLGQYQVSVSIDDSAAVSIGSAGNLLTGNAGQAVRITVTVNHPFFANTGRLPVRITSYRTNF